MTEAATLEDAISIAAEAHRGQRDKAGAPYLLHPLRLMLRMDSEAAMMAAVLHDVVEDSDWTLERLRERGFSEEVVGAVACLTHRDGESYEDFVVRRLDFTSTAACRCRSRSGLRGLRRARSRRSRRRAPVG